MRLPVFVTIRPTVLTEITRDAEHVAQPHVAVTIDVVPDIVAADARTSSVFPLDEDIAQSDAPVVIVVAPARRLRRRCRHPGGRS